MKRLLLATVLLISCSACNGHADPASISGQDSPQQPRAAVRPVTRDEHQPVLVAFGDSLTAGLGAGDGSSYPDYLQKELDARGYHYHVINEGVSGATSKDAVDRVDDIVSLHPAVVIVGFGGNDGLRGVPPPQLEENLDLVVHKLRQARARVVIAGITLPPNFGELYLSRFNAVFTSVARKNHLPLLPFMLLNVWNVPGDMQADGIHPTAQGNEQVARNLLPVVEPLLTK